MTRDTDENYTEAETIRRSEAALKRMLNTPPTPHAKVKRKPSRPKRATAKARKRD